MACLLTLTCFLVGRRTICSKVCLLCYSQILQSSPYYAQQSTYYARVMPGSLTAFNAEKTKRQVASVSKCSFTIIIILQSWEACQWSWQPVSCWLHCRNKPTVCLLKCLLYQCCSSPPRKQGRSTAVWLKPLHGPMHYSASQTCAAANCVCNVLFSFMPDEQVQFRIQ